MIGLAFASVAIDSIGVVPVLSLGAAMWIVGGVYALLRLPPETGVTTAAPRVSEDLEGTPA